MYETLITVVGNVATDITYKETAAGVPMARFRLATTVRRFDRERGGWADAYTSFYTGVGMADASRQSHGLGGGR